MTRILFAASEAFPYIKTGGLADVAGHLPRALKKIGVDVTLVIPGYKKVLDERETEVCGYCQTVSGYALLRKLKKADEFPVLFVDHPLFSSRDGSPYMGDDGEDWPDNDVRFSIFSEVIVGLAQERAVLDEPMVFDAVHCNDWQTGLVPALLKQEPSAPPSIFTVHNLAYQGTFPKETMERAGLPDALWSMDGLEFHGQVCFIKGGIFFADQVTTVSPNYAEEIKTEAFGCGMEGLLQYRSEDLSGIVNGIDDREWNPRYDKLLPFRYGVSSLSKKAINKRFLQNRMELAVEDDIFLLGSVGRLAHQKGADLILEILPELMDMAVQLVIVGSGDAELAARLEEAAERYPQQMAVFIGYDEELAHWVEAGSDAFLMPSRFEPCGLNQMYSQAYGTPPIVSPTGGLVDTVVRVTEETIKDQTASGFFMPDMDAQGLLAAVREALEYYRNLDQWQKLMRQGMGKDFSWKPSAESYLGIYQDLIASAQATALEEMAQKLTE